MEFNFKKFFIVVSLVLGTFVYVSKNYTFQDVLAYENAHQNWTWGPAADYYIGVAYYMRDRNSEAAAAFDQLLTNYPTCQYVPYALYRTGSAHQNMLHWDKAREAYQKYIEQFPQGREIEMVNKKFEFIKFK